MSSLRSAIDEAARADSLLVASDFDGTLAQLVDSPADATLHPRAESAIRLLCGCKATHVLVISGRALSDLKPRLSGLPGIELIGSHGNERETLSTNKCASDHYGRIFEVLRGIAAHADGAWIESKPLSLVLHFRAVPENQRDELQRMLRLFIPTSLVDNVLVGRDTVEYLFAREDKGSALLAAIESRSPDRVWFAGDDVTDEAAFGVLRAGDIGLKIGPEPSIANYCVATLHEALDALERLAEQRHAHAR